MLGLTSQTAAQEIVLHFHKRPPYQSMQARQLTGLTGAPAVAAFNRAGILFTVQETPAARQLIMAKENRGQHCFIGWFWNRERDAFARFTKPIYQDRPYVILFAADHPQLQQTRSLSALLGDSTLTLLTKKSYSYGRSLDALITTYRPPQLAVTVENIQMLKMLQAKRGDYMFVAPEEARQIITAAGFQESQFRQQPPDDMPPGENRHIMCTKAVGAELIARIDAAIR